MLPAAGLLMKPTVILFLALMVSMAANAGLWKLWQGQVQKVGQVAAERDQAIAAGKRCSDGVSALKKATDAKAKTLEARLREASARKVEAEVRVIETLREVPAKPDNLCESASILTDEKLEARRKARDAAKPTAEPTPMPVIPEISPARPLITEHEDHLPTWAKEELAGVSHSADTLTAMKEDGR